MLILCLMAVAKIYLSSKDMTSGSMQASNWSNTDSETYIGSDLSDDDEELSSPDILADLYRRDRTLYIDHSSDIELESDDGDELSTVRALRDHNPRLGSFRGLGRRELPSRVQVVDLADVDDEELYESHISNGRATKRAIAKEKGVLAPHARFFIEKEKSSVSVTFEPEV